MSGLCFTSVFTTCATKLNIEELIQGRENTFPEEKILSGKLLIDIFFCAEMIPMFLPPRTCYDVKSRLRLHHVLTEVCLNLSLIKVLGSFETCNHLLDLAEIGHVT